MIRLGVTGQKRVNSKTCQGTFSGLTNHQTNLGLGKSELLYHLILSCLALKLYAVIKKIYVFC